MISSLQLAKICGVSQGTVDRALHDRGGISPRTRKLILDAAEKHGYLANPAARELMTGRSCWVGAVLPSMTSPFFSDLFEAIRESLALEGLRLLWTSASSDGEVIEVLSDFAARRARAAIVVPPDSSLDIPANIAKSMHVFCLINPISSKNVSILYPDEVMTGYTGAEYLYSKGHRRILYMNYSRKSQANIDRLNGYLSFMEKKNLKPEVMSPFIPEELISECRSGKGPTAIFCHNDWLALKVIRTLEAAGLRVPGDISVLGVDNSPSFNAFCSNMSTLEYPYAQIAKAVADSVSSGRRIRKQSFKPFKIIERETVGKKE